VILSFHGADRGVTGSCHLLESGGRRVLVDCGLLQGGRDLDEENAAAFGFVPASIDVVLLAHAHLDHCGRLPLLVKRGFRGQIVATGDRWRFYRDNGAVACGSAAVNWVPTGLQPSRRSRAASSDRRGSRSAGWRDRRLHNRGGRPVGQVQRSHVLVDARDGRCVGDLRDWAISR
jgi:glyoxylase-like metal-dependent hydrolase (beta-lactamase superfamily II)